MKNFFKRISDAWQFFRVGRTRYLSEADKRDRDASRKPVSRLRNMWANLQEAYDPEAEIFKPAAEHPMGAFLSDLKAGRAKVHESSRFLEAKRNAAGHIILESIRPMPAAANAKVLEAARAKESDFSTDTSTTQYDSGQYTEFTPLMGGPFNKQLYLQGMLDMFAKVFEACNHNPLAKRIIDIYTDYILGSGFKVYSKDTKAMALWDAFDKKHKIAFKLRHYWLPNYIKYGEVMVDLLTKRGIDSSTIWEIVTNPENCDEVYYYHQQFPTAYQLYTGAIIAGVPNAEKQRPTEYIIRQLPWYQVIHLKGNCEENEKRGRSILFPVLGWLKRIKDLYNAEVIKAWLGACFIWDDTIDGEASDITAHMEKYADMPMAGSVFAHNKAVERKAMPAIERATTFADGIAGQIIAFIATGVGIPKEWFNVSTGGTRATAILASEPFAKVVDRGQEDMTELLNRLAAQCWKEAGMQYRGELEFIFPEITDSTTSEKIKNISMGKAEGFIGQETAAVMYASEMHIATYDYNKEMAAIQGEQAAAMNTGAAAALTGGACPDCGGVHPAGAPHQPAADTDQPPVQGEDSGIRGEKGGAMKDDLKK